MKENDWGDPVASAFFERTFRPDPDSPEFGLSLAKRLAADVVAVDLAEVVELAPKFLFEQSSGSVFPVPTRVYGVNGK